MLLPEKFLKSVALTSNIISPECTIPIAPSSVTRCQRPRKLAPIPILRPEPTFNTVILWRKSTRSNQREPWLWDFMTCLQSNHANSTRLDVNWTTPRYFDKLRTVSDTAIQNRFLIKAWTRYQIAYFSCTHDRTRRSSHNSKLTDVLC
jgi:hypothetical protein